MGIALFLARASIQFRKHAFVPFDACFPCQVGCIIHCDRQQSTRAKNPTGACTTVQEENK
eukprot:451166-Pelagomonas_calceolata.AAC.2